VASFQWLYSAASEENVEEKIQLKSNIKPCRLNSNQKMKYEENRRNICREKILKLKKIEEASRRKSKHLEESEEMKKKWPKA